MPVLRSTVVDSTAREGEDGDRSWVWERVLELYAQAV